MITVDDVTRAHIFQIEAIEIFPGTVVQGLEHDAERSSIGKTERLPVEGCGVSDLQRERCRKVRRPETHVRNPISSLDRNK